MPNLLGRSFRFRLTLYPVHLFIPGYDKEGSQNEYFKNRIKKIQSHREIPEKFPIKPTSDARRKTLLVCYHDFKRPHELAEVMDVPYVKANKIQ